MFKRSITRWATVAALTLAWGGFVGRSASADINWVITSGSITMSGFYNPGVTYPWTEQSPGSMTTTLSGYYSSNAGFLTNIKFAAEPTFPSAPNDEDYPLGVEDPQYIADYGQWADVTLPASAKAQNHIVAGLTKGGANMQPYFPPPTPPPPLPPFPEPPLNSGPANFGGLAVQDFTNHTPYPFAGRDYRATFWTNTTDATPDADDAPYLPNGVPLNPATGVFDPAVAASGSYLNFDFYWPDFLGGVIGRLPTRGTDPNIATTMGVIGRDGSAYTMVLPNKLSLALVGAGGFGLYLQTDVLIHAKANVSPGDVNFDNVVDISDVQTIAAHFSELGLLTPGNANGDNVVDISDVQMLAANWMHTSPGLPGGGGGDPETVPEPSSLVLAAAAVVLGVVARSRRRR